MEGHASLASAPRMRGQARLRPRGLGLLRDAKHAAGRCSRSQAGLGPLSGPPQESRVEPSRVAAPPHPLSLGLTPDATAPGGWREGRRAGLAAQGLPARPSQAAQHPCQTTQTPSVCSTHVPRVLLLLLRRLPTARHRKHELTEPQIRVCVGRTCGVLQRCNSQAHLHSCRGQLQRRCGSGKGANVVSCTARAGARVQVRGAQTQ